MNRLNSTIQSADNPEQLATYDIGQMALDMHSKETKLDLTESLETYELELSELLLERAAGEIHRKEEQFYRNAILGTDWRETAVLRIIHYPPAPAPALGRPDDPFTIEVGEYSVERYEERAPPLSEHTDATGDRASVATITWPLLERLAKDHEEIARLVDVALGPRYR